MFNDQDLNFFLNLVNQDPLVIVTIIILPTIINGVVVYSFINNIVPVDTTTHLLITTYLFPLLGFN